MRILSLNCWNGRFSAEIIAFIHSVKPDILCLQEVLWATKGTPRPLYAYGNQKPEIAGNPFNPHLFGEIKNALTEHMGMLYTSQTIPMHDEHGAPVMDVTWGPAVFVRNTFSVIRVESVWVYGSYHHNKPVSNPTSQQAVGIRLCRHDNGETLSVVNMHGIWNGNGKEDCPERHMQATRLQRLVERIRKDETEHTVVCGDFNVAPNSRLFHDLHALGLTDLVTTRGFTDTRTQHCPHTMRYADYMFVSDDLPVRNFTVVADPVISDHRPLILDID